MNTSPFPESSGYGLADRLSKDVDSRVLGLVAKIPGISGNNWTLVALGGYGRMELCPFSDLDILLIMRKRMPRRDIEGILATIVYPLWNDGFDVSYSVRTLRETLRDARNDFFFMTSLLDARLLWGSSSIFDDLVRGLTVSRGSRLKKCFLEDLAYHNKIRHEKFGDASYALEPNLKDGIGGLRDYHSIIWLAKALYGLTSIKDVLSRDLANDIDVEELFKAVDNMLLVRSLLHKVSSRKNDKLYFEYQDQLTSMLGIKGDDKALAEEILMRHVHQDARIIKMMCETVFATFRRRLFPYREGESKAIDDDFEVVSTEIRFSNDPDLAQRPMLIIKAFEHVARLGFGLSPVSRAKLRRGLNKIGRLGKDREIREPFMNILMGQHAKDALIQMLETGVLERILPEFETIKGRVQSGIYHKFTVDLHSILTLSEVKRLEQLIPDVFSRVKRKQALYLGALLHDIGKGYGEDHTEKGSNIAYRIARRMGFIEADADCVRFLVRNHLLLSEVALRRDLSEERVAVQLAKATGDIQRLSMLYILTMADTLASGPLESSEWKTALIDDLYLKSLHILERGVFREQANMKELDMKWQKLIQEVPKRLGLRQAGCLWALPQVYVLNFDVHEILEHIKLSKAISKTRPIALDVSQKGEHFALTLITRDRPGLFAILTGILALNHIEILQARVFTWLDGLAVDVFEVLTPWPDYREWDKIFQHFKLVSSGEMDLASALVDKQPLFNTGGKIRKKKVVTVNVDNESSDFFTIIEVDGPRTLGMTYNISSVLSEAGLNIHRAFISTQDNMYTNVFYVVDSFGEKLYEIGQEENILNTIKERCS